ncbi:hypothetical protein ACIGEP_06140 [Microbacterium sp. NPDC077663]|uniref:hypothetical protein n=1 Tax=Microbacterium sp. NPDC077663 TaxID=3364189 RepID=UPI0037CBC726
MTDGEHTGDTAPCADGHVSDGVGSTSRRNPHADEIAALDAQIDRHPAAKIRHRMRDLGRVERVFHRYSLMLSQLLHELETSEEAAVELMRNVGNMSGRERIIVSLDQALLSYVASLVAVIDQARSLVAERSEALRDRYAARTEQIMSDLPQASFLRKLRNYILHRVAAPWAFDGRFDARGAADTRISLRTAELLESERGWSSQAKAYLLSSGEKIQLSPLIEPYRVAMVTHIDLTLQEVHAEIEPSLEEVRRLALKRHRLASYGVTDGEGWDDLIAHIKENTHRERRGEPALNYETGLPFAEKPRDDG